jgi:hypothetical protein
MLREKTAEALVRAPARLCELDLAPYSDDDIEASEAAAKSGFEMDSQNSSDEHQDLEDDFIFPLLRIA